MENVLPIKNRTELRSWYLANAKKEKELWVEVIRKKPKEDGHLYYLDAVEEAICFGWIDSVFKEVNGKNYQRFSPRKKNSPWTMLNIERAKRLIKLKLMTPLGKKALPKKLTYKLDDEFILLLKEYRILTKFKSFPPLYQRIRAYNLNFYKELDDEYYKRSLKHFVKETKKGKMYGEWNDYGRLLNY